MKHPWYLTVTLASFNLLALIVRHLRQLSPTCAAFFLIGDREALSV